MQIRVAGIILVWVAASGLQTSPVMKPDWGVVLTAEQAQSFRRPQLCSRPAPGPIESIWIPDEATIHALEAALGPALQAALDRTLVAPVKPRAEDYYRQYAGFVVAGKRIVYVNGFHKTTVDRLPGRPTPWRTTALMPCDGGLLFFGAEYSIESGAISKVLFQNGG